MKFSLAVSTLVLLLPLFADASPQRGRQGQRQRGGNNGQAAAQAKAAAAAKAAAQSKAGGNKGGAAAASTSAAAAAAATSVATGQAQSGKLSADAQTSLQLDPSQVQAGLAQDGQAVQEAGQVSSLTSVNNFINFCGTVSNLPLTNGQQVVTGSCNPTIMGVIVPKASMPSSKFVFPQNLGSVPANQEFTIKMAINNLVTGNFVNPNTNYFAAPAQINGQGQLIGHSHVVVEQLSSFQDTTPTNPLNFAFFKGMNTAAQGGVLTADVANGLPAGNYRLCSINTAANHQPALVAVAQHGSLDDCVYFSSVAGGGQGQGQGQAQASNSTAAAAAAASSAAAAAGGQQGKAQGQQQQQQQQQGQGQQSKGQTGQQQTQGQTGQQKAQGQTGQQQTQGQTGQQKAQGQQKAGQQAQGGQQAKAQGQGGRFRNGRKGRGRF